MSLKSAERQRAAFDGGVHYTLLERTIGVSPVDCHPRSVGDLRNREAGAEEKVPSSGHRAKSGTAFQSVSQFCLTCTKIAKRSGWTHAAMGATLNLRRSIEARNA